MTSVDAGKLTERPHVYYIFDGYDFETDGFHDDKEISSRACFHKPGLFLKMK
jgi:hypothetical protein